MLARARDPAPRLVGHPEIFGNFLLLFREPRIVEATGAASKRRGPQIQAFQHSPAETCEISGDPGSRLGPLEHLKTTRNFEELYNSLSVYLSAAVYKYMCTDISIYIYIYIHIYKGIY